MTELTEQSLIEEMFPDSLHMRMSIHMAIQLRNLLLKTLNTKATWLFSSCNG